MEDFQVQITREFTSERGFTVWPGDVYIGLMGTAEQAAESGTEVKVAGEYIYIPASCFKVLTDSSY